MEKFTITTKKRIEFAESITFNPMDVIQVGMASIVIKYVDDKRFVSIMVGVEMEDDNKVVPLTLPIYYQFDNGETDEEVAYEVASYADPISQHLDDSVIVIHADGSTSTFEIEIEDME